MKMPNDFDDNSNMTLTVVMSIVAVSAFVAVILLTVSAAEPEKHYFCGTFTAG